MQHTRSIHLQIAGDIHLWCLAGPPIHERKTLGWRLGPRSAGGSSAWPRHSAAKTGLGGGCLGLGVAVSIQYWDL